jgi:enoyl-CoA hydratase/carnithine racemase
MTENNEPCVLVETLPSGNGYHIGVATLNAPKSLNSLTLEMVEILTPQFQAWEQDDSIACVVLRGSGDRALCAGGDVIQLRNSALAGDGAAAEFFEKEYRLDYLIHVFSKPIIAWGHGVVMGGGMGLLAGASHRVVTPETRLGMPEVTIGLFPDVGGSWFLNRTPGRTGLFLALTGASINAGDTLYLGMADRFLKHEQWDDMIAGLGNVQWQTPNRHHGQVSHLLRDLESNAGEPPASVVRDHYDIIQTMTDGDSLEDIFRMITSYEGDDKWLSRAASTLASGCPTTIWLIYHQLQRCLHLSLREVFQAELILAANCMIYGNFAEGVRALLVDKDKAPRFDPPRFQDVPPDFVAKHFQPPWGDKPHPLADL